MVPNASERWNLFPRCILFVDHVHCRVPVDHAACHQAASVTATASAPAPTAVTVDGTPCMAVPRLSPGVMGRAYPPSCARAVGAQGGALDSDNGRVVLDTWRP